MSDDVRERRFVADSIRRARDRVAVEVTDEFLRCHPDWVDRYGDRARTRGIEDARFHADFLASAIEAGGAEPFAAYARWTARVLAARKIAPEFLAENLREIGRTFCLGLDGAAAELVRRTVDAGAAAAMEAPAVETDAAGGPLAGSRAVFTQAALAGDRLAAGTVAREAIREGHDVTSVYVDVLEKSQYEIGKLWAANRITVAEEHMATAVTQFVVSQLYALLERSAERRGPAVVTGIEGELHQLGGHMVADVLESDGWDVRFLGTNLSADGVLRIVAEHQPRLVGISATMLFNLDKVVALMERLRAVAGPPRIVVGGGVFRSAPGLWREIGADGFSFDLGDVVTMVRSVVGESGDPRVSPRTGAGTASWSST